MVFVELLWYILLLCILVNCVKSSNVDGLSKYGASTIHYGHHMEISKSTHTISTTLSTSFKEDVISPSIQCIPATTQLEVNNKVASRKCTPKSIRDHSYQVVNLSKRPWFIAIILCVNKAKLVATISCVDKTKLHSTTTHPDAGYAPKKIQH